jgi:PAS domain S-box-containing protein
MDAANAVNIDFLVAGGEMGERIRNYDWNKTPLGPPESWSISLQTTVGIMLSNRLPMLLWWGPEYICIYNDAYIPILGAKHPWGLGKPVKECWSEIWHILQPLIDTPFYGGPATWMEDIPLDIKRHNFTEETHFTIAYSPVPDETVPNRIGGVLATVTEITDKVVGERRVTILKDVVINAAEAKTAEEACKLAASTISEHPNDITFSLFYLIDESGRKLILQASTGVECGTPFSPSQFDLDHDKEDRLPFSEVLSKGKMLTIENIDSGLNNGSSWVSSTDPSSTAVVIPIPSGRPHHFAGIMVAGVSPRLPFKESYRNFLELLTTQVATAITNARAFDEERKRAEALAEIDKAKTAFFSNISHEFRTPLTLMLAPIEEALQDPNTIPENRKRLDLVHRNALRMQKLVNNLLDFSRIEAGRITATFEPVDLSAFTIDLASSFRSLIEKEGIQFIVDCPTLTKEVWVDRDMWEKIVFNLLSNAYKYTWQGQIMIRLGENDGKVHLHVKDSGVGIPAEELDKVFLRFHRVQNSNGRTFEGTGIGLSLVNELVKLHGGQITVESEVKKGSEFIVSIPYKNSSVEKQSFVEYKPADSYTADSYIKEAMHWTNKDTTSELGVNKTPEKKRLVVADDNADMRYYFSRLLSAGYDIISVADGKSALEAIKKQAPDLVISDIMMPGMDGFELLDAIKSDPERKSIPVILVSARAGEEAVNEALQKGADAYLVKPFKGQQLKAIVQNRLALKVTQDKITESEKQFRNVLLQSPNIFVIIKGKDRMIIDFVNEPFLRSTGRDWSILGKEMLEVFPEVNNQPFPGQLRNVFETGHVFYGDEVKALLVKNGKLTESYFNYVYQPVFDNENNVTAITVMATDITEEIVARKKINDSEDRFRTMAGEAPLFIWDTDENLRTTFLNKEGCTYFNWDTSRPISELSWKKYIHPDDLERVLETMRESARSHKPYSLEMRIRNGITGQYRWFLDQGVPRYNEKLFMGFIGTTLDIHDRREMEIDLEEKVKSRTNELNEQNKLLIRQNELVKRILDSSFDLITVYDTEARIITVNQSTLDILNKQENEVVGKRLLDILPQMKDSKGYDDLCRAIDGELVHNEIYQSIISGRYYENFLIPLRDLNDKVYAVLAMAHDVTDLIGSADRLKTKNEELETTKSFLEQLLDSSVEYIVVVDKDICVITANRKFEDGIGVCRNDIKGKSLFEINPKTRDTHLHEKINRALQGETIYIEKSRSFARPDIFVDTYLVPLIQYEKVEGVIIMSRDVTDIVRSEMLLENKNKELEEIIAMLRNQEQKDRQKDNFIQMASHELKTPLTSIKAYSQLLTRIYAETDDNFLKNGLTKVDTQVNKMNKMVSDFLNLSQIESGKFNIDKEIVNLTELVREITSDIQMVAVNHVIYFDGIPGVYVKADKEKLAQVIINLLNNAIKYSPDKRNIDIDMAAKDGWASVSIRDYGVGIPIEEHEKIFQRFYRAPNNTNNISGFGIGLYISSEIMKRHGGTIVVESTPGEGSTFIVKIPLSK